MAAHLVCLAVFLCAAWGAHAALSEIPTISMSAAQSEDELVVGPRFTPNQFQYRITRTRETRAYPPWVSDAVMDSVMSPGITCAQYLQKDRIRFRGETGELQEIPLAPVPLEQTWAPDGTKLRTDSPGIQRNRVSSCCDAETCPDRCLLFRSGEPWFLEINAPSWAVYKVTDGYQPEDVAFGLVTFTPQEQIIKKDPGIWPVMRIPCLFCPIKSCITNCSNGEYSSGYADSTVSDPCSPAPSTRPDACFSQESRRIECSASPAPLEHGIRARIKLLADGSSRRTPGTCAWDRTSTFFLEAPVLFVPI